MVVVKVVLFFLPPVTAVKVRCLGKMNIEYTEMFGKLCAWRGSSVQLPGLRGYIGPVVYCHRVSPALKKLPRWVEAWFNKPQISVVCHSGVIYKQKTNNCLCRKRSRQAGSPYTSTLAGASQWNVIHHVRHRSQGWDTMNNPAGLCLYSLYLSSPPSLYFPFTHFLSVSTRSFSPWVVSALTAVLTPFVLVVRSRSAAFTITADLGAIKMVNSEQRLDMRDGKRHPRRRLWRGSEKMSARERERKRKQKRGAWMWFGKWLLFPGAIRLWSGALHHWLHCSLFPLTPRLLQIWRFPLCQHIRTSLKKLAVNNEVPPPVLPPPQPLWEHAAAAVP